MPVTFIGSATTNFRVGRPAGFRPEAIVLHRTGGSRAFWRSRFNTAAATISAHYVVGRDGTVDMYVLETDTAFHAGMVVGPTWTGLRPNVNPNFYTIGIELEGGASDDWPDAQVQATAALVAEVAARWQFGVDSDHVIPHSAIRAPSRCPGDTCPIRRIIELARGAAARPRPPRDTIVRTLSRANLRRASPSQQAPVIRVIPADTQVIVQGFVDTGDRVQGNSFWYWDGEDGFLWAGVTDVPEPIADDGRVTISVEDSATTDPMEIEERASRPAPPSSTAPSNRQPSTSEPPIDRTKFVLAPKEFAGDVLRKDLVVLHFTAGTTAKSAFDTWRVDPQRVATAYVVDVDGTIYEVFPPQFWAAHLGVKGTNNLHDKRSIGIEIVNVGPLQSSTQDPSVLNWWPRKSKDAPDFSTKFCRLDETHRYMPGPYRGKSHFASFPNVQIDAVSALVRTVCDRFSIRPTLPASSKRFEFDSVTFATYKGVCSHANFRPDKWDLGPAFPWERLGL